MPIPFVVLVRDPKAQTFSWCPVIAENAEQALGVVGQTFAQAGDGHKLLVGAFTREQVLSATPLFDAMDGLIQKKG